MPETDDLNADSRLPQAPCPHCLQPAGVWGRAHWKPEVEPIPGTSPVRHITHVFCKRAPRRTSHERKTVYGFACPTLHTCYRVSMRVLPKFPWEQANEEPTS